MSDTIDERWAARVQELAEHLDYPPTPDLAAGVRQRLAKSRGRVPAHRRRLVRVAAALAVLLILLAALLAVPQVRAAVRELLGLGAVHILPAEPQPEPGITTPTATPLPSVLDLAGETTLEEARRQVGFALRLPTYPPDLGPPDRVFVQDMGGPVVVLVWLDGGQVRLALHELGPGTYAGKIQPPVVQETQVNGQPALWTEGPYLLVMKDGQVQVWRLVQGHVLVWVEGEITYRLETGLGLDEAIRIAESLK